MYNKSKPKKMLQEQRLGNEKGWGEGGREKERREGRSHVGEKVGRKKGDWMNQRKGRY